MDTGVIPRYAAPAAARVRASRRRARASHNACIVGRRGLGERRDHHSASTRRRGDARDGAVLSGRRQRRATPGCSLARCVRGPRMAGEHVVLAQLPFQFARHARSRQSRHALTTCAKLANEPSLIAIIRRAGDDDLHSSHTGGTRDPRGARVN